MRYLAILFFLGGCADDLSSGTTVSETGAGFTIVDGDVTIDATDEKLWVYFNLSDQQVVEPADPENDTTWDIGLKRYNVKLNGGISGVGEVEAAELMSEDYSLLQMAPADGYMTDEADSDGDGVDEYALGTWYDYDYMTHVLTAADKVYVLRTVNGAYVKLQFQDYYDDAGTSAMVQFSYASVEAP